MDYGKELCLESFWYLCEEDLVLKVEEWRDVKECNDYQVSDLGRIKSLSRDFLYRGEFHHVMDEKILSQSVNSRGYYNVGLYKNKKRNTRQVHQLVAIAFLNHTPCGMELVINHKNFTKTCNMKFNIETVSQRENANQKHLKSKSKLIGAIWSQYKNKWISRIRINGKTKYLGSFANDLDAHNAYKKALSEINNNR